jgi:hypothetical protein
MITAPVKAHAAVKRGPIITQLTIAGAYISRTNYRREAPRTRALGSSPWSIDRMPPNTL